MKLINQSISQLLSLFFYHFSWTDPSIVKRFIEKFVNSENISSIPGLKTKQTDSTEKINVEFLI